MTKKIFALSALIYISSVCAAVAQDSTAVAQQDTVAIAKDTVAVFKDTVAVTKDTVAVTKDTVNPIVIQAPQIPSAPESHEIIVVDKVVAVVGNKIILESEVQAQFMQAQARNSNVNKAKVFEDLLYQKLLVAQAEIDSIDVKITAKQVEDQVTEKLNRFIDEMGGVEKMEEYFNKPLAEIKEDLRDVTRDQLIASAEQDEITKEIKVTPSDVNKYFKSLPKDSLPLIDLQYEICEIVIHPAISKKDRDEVKRRLLDIKNDVLNNGALFETKAVLYSEDPGSAVDGGELGMMSRGELVPEFAAAAFSLKKDSISDVVESDFGFHIIQLIDRKGERINVRHILMKPKFSAEAKVQAKTKIDSIYNILINKTMTFEDAAKLYSTNDKTGKNGGVRVNPYSGNAKFTVDVLQSYAPADYYYIRNMKEGEISRPIESYDDRGNFAYKILYVKTRTEPHVANIETDYQTIQEMALQRKHEQAYDKWVKEKSQSVYVKIADEYKNYDFKYKGWIHNEYER